ncbi:Ig-like domain-containing protein, partial [Rosenbergiella nectarea]
AVVSDDGVTVTGKAEAGSTVAIKDADGTTLGSAKVAADGTFTVTLDPAQTNGQILSVTATDAANNTSLATTTTAPDTTAPATPTDVVVSDDGVTVTGKAEAGSKVAIKDAAGTTLGNTTATADGTFTVTLDPAQTNGQILSVVSTDTAGNASDPASVTAKDTTAPVEPSDVQLDAAGSIVTGKGEVGSTVTVTDTSGKALGTGTIGADGSFSVTLTTPQTNGQTLSVVSTDTAGNASDPASVTAKDTTAPVEPSDVQLDAAGSIVTGKGEVGSTVTVTDASGKALGTGTVGADGSFSVTLTTPQTNGQILSVVSTDTAGNASDPASVTAKDTTAPVEPSDVQLDAAGSIVTGKGEVGSTVTVTDTSGKALGTGTIGADGSFSVTLTTPQTNGQTLSIVSTDTAGNASDPASVTAKDTTAPTEPSGVQLSDDGKTITGKGEAGSTVTVKDGEGKELGHATV